jgi:quinol monooxygenase YgiN
MFIRSAFWTGTPKPGMDEAFRQLIDQQMVPAFRTLPGVRTARALWPLRREDNPPPVHCQFLVEFDDDDALQRMLRSPERLALRPKVAELIGMFDGTVSHIEYEVGAA